MPRPTISQEEIDDIGDRSLFRLLALCRKIMWTCGCTGSHMAHFFAQAGHDKILKLPASKHTAEQAERVQRAIRENFAVCPTKQLRLGTAVVARDRP